MSVWAAILAGGSGTRFWPLSTPERPKQLLPLAGDRPLLVQAVERLSETTVRIDGSFTIDDFNEEFQTTLDSDDFHTVAGYVFGHLGRAAEVGDEVVEEQLRFRVLETSGTRIQRLEVEFLPAPVGADDTPEAA